jgi:hypothetical protein
VELTLSVTVYEPLVTVLGTIDAFKFAESGDAKRFTGELKPLVGVTVIVDVCGVGPALTVRAGGFAVR